MKKAVIVCILVAVLACMFTSVAFATPQEPDNTKYWVLVQASSAQQMYFESVNQIYYTGHNGLRVETGYMDVWHSENDGETWKKYVNYPDSVNCNFPDSYYPDNKGYIIDASHTVYTFNSNPPEVYFGVYLPEDGIEHLYGTGYNTNTDITRDLKYNDVEFDVLIQEQYVYFLANISYENLYLHVYEASEILIEGHEYIDENEEIQTGKLFGCELSYTRTIDIGEKDKNEIFQVSIEEIGMNSYQDGYVLVFTEDGQSLYDSWDPMPYYSYGEIWSGDTIVDYIINPSNEVITDEEYPMFFFSYNKTGEIAVSEDPYIHSPDANKLVTGDLSLYWYNYTGYMQMVNLTTTNFYENIDYDLIVPATDDYINIWSTHDQFTKIPWNCNEQERLIYGPITDYFPLKDGENIIEVYNSQSSDMSNKIMIYRFMVKYAQDEIIPVNVDGGISRGTANAFSTIFRAVNETLKLIDRASFGINSSEPGFFMELSSIPACDELLNDDIKDGLNFLKNQKIILFEKEYIFYDLFTFVMSFIFGFVVIALFKNQILGIATTLKGNLTSIGKDVKRER